MRICLVISKEKIVDLWLFKFNLIDGFMEKIKYSCGHTTDGAIFVNNVSPVFSAHKVWMETTGKENKECFDCFLERMKKINVSFVEKTKEKSGALEIISVDPIEGTPIDFYRDMGGLLKKKK